MHGYLKASKRGTPFIGTAKLEAESNTHIDFELKESLVQKFEPAGGVGFLLEWYTFITAVQ